MSSSDKKDFGGSLGDSLFNFRTFCLETKGNKSRRKFSTSGSSGMVENVRRVLARKQFVSLTKHQKLMPRISSRHSSLLSLSLYLKQNLVRRTDERHRHQLAAITITAATRNSCNGRRMMLVTFLKHLACLQYTYPTSSCRQRFLISAIHCCRNSAILI